MQVHNITLEVNEHEHGDSAFLEIWDSKTDNSPGLKLAIDKTGAYEGRIHGDEFDVDDAVTIVNNALKAGFVDAEDVEKTLALLDEAQQDNEWSW